MSRWPLILLVPFLALGACGGASDDEPAASTAPSSTASTTSPTTQPAPDDPTLPTKRSGGTQRLTGVVSAGVEDGCLMLTVTSGQRGTWQLVGATGDVAVGDRVTVRGSPAPDLATRCQQGTPFVVEAVEPG
jgi:hypothetical protein